MIRSPTPAEQAVAKTSTERHPRPFAFSVHVLLRVDERDVRLCANRGGMETEGHETDICLFTPSAEKDLTEAVINYLLEHK